MDRKSERLLLKLDARIRDIAEIRSRREWFKVFSLVGNVQEANKVGREVYSNTLIDLRAEFGRLVRS